MKIELNLKDERVVNLLKTFASKHYCGAEDNLYTDRPIHLVQSKQYNYVPYSSELITEWDWELCFVEQGDYGESTDEVEFLSDYFEIDAAPFEELEGVDLEYKGGDFVIYDYDDYFEYYGLDKSDYEIMCRRHYWETRAYFLIREEAEKYKKYQAHNLGESRIYTDGYGYSNCGEWIGFYDLLLHIGDKLNEES